MVRVSASSWVLVGAVVALVAGTADAAAAPAAAPPPPRVLAASQIASATGLAAPTGHGDQTDVVTQSQVASDPLRPDSAVAVTIADFQATPAGTFGVALEEAYTGDGGATWSSQTVPGVTRVAGGTWAGVSWPAVAAAPHGVVYVAAALRQDVACHTGLGVARSADGGRTFGALTVVRQEDSCQVLEGRSSVTVDSGPHSPHRGRVYLSWVSYRSAPDGTPLAQVQSLAWSDDGGSTWSAPVDVSAPDSSTFGSTVLVAPNGRVTVVYTVNSDDFTVETLTASTSTDGGRTFAAPQPIDQVHYATVGAADLRCCTATGAIDPATGELYVASGDARRQAGEYEDAFVYRSADGTHWSAPVKADLGGPAGYEHATPVVAAYGGTVAVAWTLTPDPNGSWVRQQVATSHDGGASFGRPATLGPDGDLTYAARAAGFGYYLGDVAGISVVPGRVYVAWPLPSAPARGHAEHQTLWGATVQP